MLSFKFVADASGAAHYFESSDDYYAKDDHKGTWQGKGAEDLELGTNVDREVFKNLLDGKLPDGRQVRLSRTKGAKDRKGIDFTFSAPKSVSIQALLHGDVRILAAHDAAVNASVDMLQEFAAARRKDQGLSFREHTNHLTVATFRHELSRAQDPQLHTHAIAMNLTKRADGEWRALSNEDMLKNVKVIGAFYRATLAGELQKLGYDLRETRKGGWELAHVSDQAIAHFSKRSQEIEKLLNARGQDRDSATTGQKQTITIATRQKKTDADRDLLKKQWLETARDAGIQLDAHEGIVAKVTRAIDNLHKGVKEKISGVSAADTAAREAVNFAIEHLAERQGIFSRAELLEVAYGHGATRTTPAFIHEELHSAQQDGRLVAELPLYQTARSLNLSASELQKDAHAEKFKGHDEFEKLTRASWVALTMTTRNLTQEKAEASVDSAIQRGALVKTEPRFTTAAARASEIKVLGIEKAGRGQTLPVASPEAVANSLARSDLNEGQQDAVRMILTSTNRFTGIQGFAGTGKSHMMSKAVEGIKAEAAKLSGESGYKVIGLAPYASQNRALEELGMASQTLASFLAKKGQHSQLDSRSIIFLDEAGVVPAHQLEKLMAIVERQDARLILVGDRQQTQAVEAGKPFEQLQDAGMSLAYLTEIKRQNNETIKAAVTHAAKGEVPAAVKVLENNTVEIQKDDRRYAAIANAYMQLDKTERSNTIIVAGTNEARREVNRLVHSALALPGEQRTEILNNVDMTRAEAKAAQTYLSGHILVPQRDYAAGLRKGEQYQVVSHDVRKNSVTVQTSEGQQLTFDPSRTSMVRIYEKEVIQLAPGDWIRITHNDKELDLRNGERYQVDAISKQQISIRKGGAIVSIPNDKPVHMQYGYASTVHSAQGLTSKRVLIDANTKSLTSNRAVFYVAISRPRDDLTVFTNDKMALARAMSREPKKFAALELRDARNEGFMLAAKAERAAARKLAQTARKTPPPTQPMVVRKTANI